MDQTVDDYSTVGGESRGGLHAIYGIYIFLNGKGPGSKRTWASFFGEKKTLGYEL